MSKLYKDKSEGVLSMNIYIEDNIQIKDELINRGYCVIEDNRESCDVIICDLKNCDLNELNSKVNYKKEGSLIIDIGSKSISDIDYILNNRSYSNIF